MVVLAVLLSNRKKGSLIIYNAFLQAPGTDKREEKAHSKIILRLQYVMLRKKKKQEFEYEQKCIA